MSKAFKIELVSDVAKVLADTDKTADAFEGVADSLDEISDAGARVEKDLEDSLTGASKAAKKAGDEIADGLSEGAEKGSDEAADALSQLPGQADSAAKGAADLLTGGFDGAADKIGDTLGQALSGLGPAGMVAGALAAAGIKAIFDSAKATAEEINAAKDRVIDLAAELAQVDGNPDLIDWAEHLRDRLNEITNERKWWEFWQDEPRTRLEEWSAAAEDLGLSMGDVTEAASGSEEALRRIYDQLGYKMPTDEWESWADSIAFADFQTQNFVAEIEKMASETQRAIDYHDLEAAALDGLNGAKEIAAQATADYEEAVAKSLEGAGAAWEQYTEDGTTNLDAYNDAIEAQYAAVESFEANLVTASETLSTEALAYIQSLGPAAAPLLQAFVDAPLDQQARTATNWERIGKTATQGYDQGLDLATATKTAVDKAQSTATANKIRFGWEFSPSGLASAVMDAVASVGTPTIPIRGRVTPIID